MADEEQDKAESEQPATPRRKRKPPTIELSATEVKPEGAPATAAAAAAQSAPAPESAPSEAAPGSTDAAAPSPYQPAQSPWLIAVAAAAGAAAAVAAGVVLYLAGAFPADNRDSAEILTRLSGLEAKLERPSDRQSADAAALGAIDARIGKIEAALSARTGIDPALTTRLATIEVALKTVGDAAAGLTTQTQELAASARETRERIETIARSIESQRAADKAEGEKLAGRVAALESSTQRVEQKIETPGSTAADRDVRAALLASTLKEAVERGSPFRTELDAVAVAAADQKALAALAPFAASGVPSASALAGELRALIPALRGAAEAPAANAGFLDRLQANANRLVRVRPADEPPGNSPLEVIERVERAADRADVAAARAELARLPAPIQSLASAWLAKSQARDAALSAAHEISAQALKTMAAPGRQP
jgi:hypothetical protein